MSTQAAPGELERVRDFVNTLDVETGDDALSSPDALGAWLESRGLSVRKEAAHTLNRTAARAHVGLRFDSGGEVRLEPAARGVDAALGRLLAIAASAMADGTWTRLKACLADDCHWAFYDHARNHSRHWCSMAVCGNRTKARTYRQRHAR